MISLPLIPQDSHVDALFPGAGAMFRFQAAYELLDPDDVLTAGEGYWIYLGAAQVFVLEGMAFDRITMLAVPSGWSMIGGCSGSARGSVTHGKIRGIFGFKNGYRHLDQDATLEPGRGYWMNCSEPAALTIDMVDE